MDPQQQLTRSIIEQEFKEWWRSSYGVPPGTHALMTHTAFAEYMLLKSLGSAAAPLDGGSAEPS